MNPLILLLRALATLLLASALLVGVPGVSAQVPYDLEELTAAGHPEHPGLDFSFHAVTTTRTEAGGLAVADFDDDGWLDLFFPDTEGHGNALYRNQGDGTYLDVAAARGVDETAQRRASAAFLDFDNDGDLDLLTVGYPSHGTATGTRYTLFRNDGAPGWGFTDVTTSAGGFPHDATTLEDSSVGDAGGLAVADVDRDGFLDFVVTWWQDHRDILDPNPNPPVTNVNDQPRFFRSMPNPTPPGPGQLDWSPRVFVDDTVAAGLDVWVHGIHWMPTLTDLNRDGWPDLHMSIESGPDRVHLNDGTGEFGPDIGSLIGLNTNPPHFGNEMGFAAGDIDNDGDLDWMVTNTGNEPGRRDILYRNDSLPALGDFGLAFSDVQLASGVWESPGIGWGMVLGDLDNDRDLDIVTARGLGHPIANTVRENLWPTPSTDGLTPAFADVSAQLTDFTRLGETDKDMLRALAAFDHDNDGDLDLVGSRTGQLPASVISPLIDYPLFRNTLSPGGHWLQIDLRETGGSRNVVGVRVWVASGGPISDPDHLVQTREVIVGDSFLTAAPDRLHFGLGDELPEWIVVRWLDGSHTAIAGTVPVDQVLTITHTGTPATGDLDNDGQTDCADVAFFDLALSQPAVADAAQPSWPWRILADVDGNGTFNAVDRGGMGLYMASPWCPEGGGVAGIAGLPALTGTGPLIPGAPVALTLANARPNAFAFLLAGFDDLDLPFNGGLLVPDPQFIIGPFLTTPSGGFVLSGAWPPVAAGLSFWVQAWVDDPAAPSAYSATDGLRATAP